MMYEKASLFGDEEARGKILSAENPGKAKALGRQIRNFSEDKWLAARFEIVVRASIEKFSSTSGLENYLLATGERVLVEASPVDKIWGIGMDAESARNSPPREWKGLNLLGFALMEARQRLSEKKLN